MLQNKQDLPVSEQLEVVQAADFTGLPVVRFIEDNHDDKTPLVPSRTTQSDLWTPSENRWRRSDSSFESRKTRLPNIFCKRSFRYLASEPASTL